jgi:hypothetical protein
MVQRRYNPQSDFYLYILRTILSALLLFKLTHNLETVHEIDILKIRPKRSAHAHRS